MCKQLGAQRIAITRMQQNYHASPFYSNLKLIFEIFELQLKRFSRKHFDRSFYTAPSMFPRVMLTLLRSCTFSSSVREFSN